MIRKNGNAKAGRGQSGGYKVFLCFIADGGKRSNLIKKMIRKRSQAGLLGQKDMREGECLTQ